MKRVTLFLAVVAMMISTNLFAKKNDSKVTNVAKEIIKAYKDRNPELLKKHASGVLKSAISKNYFKDKKLKEIFKEYFKTDGDWKSIVEWEVMK